jgi:ornithine cyclodeaminase
MTRFIDIDDLRLLVKKVGLEAFVVQLADYIRSDFLRWDKFEKSPRAATHVPGGVIELMPTSDDVHYGFKYVNGHPNNTRINALTVMAFGMLADIETGSPRLISEMTLATAFRTAATSALAAKALARKDSKVMAIIGAGAQSEFQAVAFKVLLGIEEILIFDVDPKATEKFLGNLDGYPGLRLTAANSVAEAVRGADVVTTITADKTRAAILTPDLVRPGMHLNGVGGDCPGKTEIHADILRDAKVVVEFEPQTRIEGDIQQMGPDYPVTELWRILAGLEIGRESESQITIFDSVGFALEDFSTLRLLLDLSQAHELGQIINLIPQPKNPKDLYQYVRS